MKNNNSKGYSLVEIAIALLILTVAVIPLIGTITGDTKNAIVIANYEFAMQRARYILDTMLDSVDYDDLIPGTPAKLSGKSKDNFQFLMFPESDGEKCQGYFSDERGQRFFASLRVEDIPDDDTLLKFECYDNPDLLNLFNNSNPSETNYAEIASNSEKLGNPEPSCVDSNLVYGHSDWANDSKIISYHYKDFFQNSEKKNLMRVLVLHIKWNDNNKNEPGDGNKDFYLVTHKARLIK